MKEERINIWKIRGNRDELYMCLIPLAYSYLSSRLRERMWKRIPLSLKKKEIENSINYVI